jgi:hypothetical protein
MHEPTGIPVTCRGGVASEQNDGGAVRGTYDGVNGGEAPDELDHARDECEDGVGDDQPGSARRGGGGRAHQLTERLDTYTCSWRGFRKRNDAK